MSRYNESAADYGTPALQPLPMDSDLLTCFDRVRDLVPDYQWTCFYDKSTGDLKHLPTGITLSCDVNGYELYIVRTPEQPKIIRLCFDSDAPHTTDPREAVTSFVAEVVREMARYYIEGKK